MTTLTMPQQTFAPEEKQYKTVSEAINGLRKEWTIEFHERARQEIASLPDSLQKVFLRIFDRINKNGLLSLPIKFSKRIEGNIWELRATAKDGTARSLYVTQAGEVVKILVAFAKKTEKIPRDKIELAIKRSEE